MSFLVILERWTEELEGEAARSDLSGKYFDSVIQSGFATTVPNPHPLAPRQLKSPSNQARQNVLHQYFARSLPLSPLGPRTLVSTLLKHNVFVLRRKHSGPGWSVDRSTGMILFDPQT